MLIHIEKDDKDIEKKFSGSVEEILRKLKINPAGVIVVRQGRTLKLDDKLKDSDHIKILEMFIGG